jgi:hypothetical protein
VTAESTTTSSTALGFQACVRAATFASIDCRLRDLVSQVAVDVTGRIGEGLTSRLEKARALVAEASALGASKGARKRLARAGKRLRAFQRRVRKARKTLSEAARADLVGSSSEVRSDILALRGGLSG